MGYAKLVNEEENKHMTNISAWVFFICGLISTISLIVTAVFESDITAWITVITFIICVLDIVFDIGLILWDKEEETCDGCKHLYFNNDGSADCDSPCARACLMGDKRIFKENKHSKIELGCMYCSQFTGKGCKLTGVIFSELTNVAVRPKNCPKEEENEY